MATVSLKDQPKFLGAYRKLMTVLEKNPWKQMPGGENRPTITKVAGGSPDAYSLVFSPAVPVGLAWCVTDKELVFALQPEALAAHLAHPAGQESLAEAPEIAAIVNGKQEPTSVMYVNVPALFDQFYPMLSMMGPMIAAQLGRQGIEFDPAILPPAEKIKKHLLPDVAVVRRTSSGIDLHRADRPAGHQRGDDGCRSGRRSAAAGGPGGPRGRPPHTVVEQHEADRLGHAQLRPGQPRRFRRPTRPVRTASRF